MTREHKGRPGQFLPIGGDNRPLNDKDNKTEFDRVVSYYIDDRNKWRKVSFALSTAVVASVAAWIYISTLPAQIPLVVEVDSFGETRYIGAVGNSKPEGGVQRPAQAIRYFQEQYLTALRTWSTDSSVEDRMVETVRNGSTAKQYSVVVNESWAGDRSPYMRATSSQVVLTVETMFAVGKMSYQIEWIEKEYGVGGDFMGEHRYRGLMTMFYEDPKPETMRTNPLGIYVSSFEIMEVKKDEGKR